MDKPFPADRRHSRQQSRANGGWSNVVMRSSAERVGSARVLEVPGTIGSRAGERFELCVQKLDGVRARRSLPC